MWVCLVEYNSRKRPPWKAVNGIGWNSLIGQNYVYKNKSHWKSMASCFCCCSFIIRCCAENENSLIAIREFLDKPNGKIEQWFECEKGPIKDRHNGWPIYDNMENKEREPRSRMSAGIPTLFLSQRIMNLSPRFSIILHRAMWCICDWGRLALLLSDVKRQLKPVCWYIALSFLFGI